jgi:Family of unknown function (DUF6498)
MPSGSIFGEQATRGLVALLFAAYNLLPLYGLWVWHWDAFQLLILYWSETVILAAWTMLRLTFVPTALLGEIEINKQVQTATHASLIGFMSLIAGMFCAVHLFFLCTLFSGDWFRRLHGLGEILRTFYIDSGAWFPLGLVTIAGGLDSLIGDYRPQFVDTLAQLLRITLPVPPPKSLPGAPVANILSIMFNRIITMQIAVICGAWLVRHLGSIGPLAIIVGIKTVWDFGHRTGLIKADVIQM